MTENGYFMMSRHYFQNSSFFYSSEISWYNDSVTNMENRFPAMLVLWLGREFYRGKYEMTGGSEAWTPDLGDKSKIPENAILSSISLLGEEIRLNVRDDSM
ncbi:hypothetical protein AVEN_183250-1 [Araneus ventricosus]|uniref:Uncharacterized protein n=1 Tax=Araneus ventricosus TaxID=182803 RepID=A0A4Y2HUW2_ARAVE|nr:hypothetical protein AVEN_183250-1 [Araneus ventricosus]